MSYTPLFANLQPQILARGVCSRRQFVRGLPTTILVDAAQRSSWSFVGPYDWDNSELLQTLRTILTDS